MSQVVLDLGLKDNYTRTTISTICPVKVESRWSGELEKSRKSLVNNIVEWVFPAVVMTKLTMVTTSSAYAAATGADEIRKGFGEILDVFTALAEPILWFYALTACILIATKSKEKGFDRLKQVGYAYAGIALLPTFFSLLRWVSDMIKGAIAF